MDEIFDFAETAADAPLDLILRDKDDSKRMDEIFKSLRASKDALVSYVDELLGGNDSLGSIKGQIEGLVDNANFYSLRDNQALKVARIGDEQQRHKLLDNYRNKIDKIKDDIKAAKPDIDTEGLHKAFRPIQDAYGEYVISFNRPSLFTSPLTFVGATLGAIGVAKGVIDLFRQYTTGIGKEVTSLLTAAVGTLIGFASLHKGFQENLVKPLPKFLQDMLVHPTFNKDPFEKQ